MNYEAWTRDDFLAKTSGPVVDAFKKILVEMISESVKLSGESKNIKLTTFYYLWEYFKKGCIV